MKDVKAIEPIDLIKWEFRHLMNTGQKKVALEFLAWAMVQLGLRVLRRTDD